MLTVTTVIPAYNEGDLLRTFLLAWAEQGASHHGVAATACVVDDGSGPEDEATHRSAVEEAGAMLARARAPHQVQYLRSPKNQGKGASIRWGWRVADPASTWLGFVDGDGAFSASEYWRLADQLSGGAFDVLMGSRTNVAGRTVLRSRYRRFQGRAFATAVETLFHLGLYDSQCGLKFFRAELLWPLVDRLREDRWLLDVEVLAWMKRAGARAVEVPVDCFDRGTSNLVLGLDPAKMLIGLLALRARLGRG